VQAKYNQGSTLTRTQNRLKVQLKLSISRLRMAQQKDEAIAKQQRRAMAQLLEVRHHYPPPLSLVTMHFYH